MKCVFLFMAALVLATGCDPSGKSPGTGEYTARAKRLAGQGEFATAAAAYEQALQEDPRLANVHLEVGLLYDEKLGDPIAAIYHYRQFIKLTPQPEKQQVVKDFIQRAELTLASRLPQASLVDPAELRQMQDEKASLMNDNIALKNRVTELEKALADFQAAAAAQPPAAPTPPPPVAVVTAPPVAEPPPTPPRSQVTHIVQKGDTLQSLALRYYGTRSAWTKIYEANRNSIPSPSQVKIGQVLVIP
jgi:tetratricopeptide (TPR) repeat protein